MSGALAVAELGWKALRKIAPRAARDIAESSWSIGCEVLDRDIARYSAYREYLGPLGAKGVRLQAVAWHVGWSEEHFCRVFRAMTGQPSAQYIRHARIEQAKNRLLGTSDSVAQIAARTGPRPVKIVLPGIRGQA